IESKRSTMTISSLGSFKVSYPQTWAVEELSGVPGYMFSKPESKAQVVVVKQKKSAATTSGSASSAGTTDASLSAGKIDKNTASSYIVVDGNTLEVEYRKTEEGTVLTAVHIPLDEEEELFVYGTPGDEFNDIVESLTFTEPEVASPQTLPDAGEACIHVTPDSGGSDAVSCY
ncbi:MAG: hypothetical protein KBD29_01830, partial [Candidatus Magasanikbacteria bacterium]|nr:hypothetical protein [Candidatus Magasanikbacteria bacterium]